MLTPVDLTGYFIGLCFVIFVAFWTATAFSTKRTVQRRGWWRVSFLVITLGFFLARMGLLGVHWVNGFLWHRTLFTGVVADAIVLAGLAVMLWARVILGRNWSADVALKEGHELVTSGPYRWVRHPIYSGLLLMALGWAVWRGRYSGFWGLAVLLLLFWIKARAEEQLMIQHFGDAYRSYKARVKALIPYVV
jgi:protein-S-isoprenylcysteine O-methyltransferase Ste14